MEYGEWRIDYTFWGHVRLSEWTYRQAPGRNVTVPGPFGNLGADELSCKTQPVLARRMAHTSAARCRCDQVRRWAVSVSQLQHWGQCPATKEPLISVRRPGKSNFGTADVVWLVHCDT